MRWVLGVWLLALATVAPCQASRPWLAALARIYGIEIVVADHPIMFTHGDYNVSADPVTEAMLDRYVPIFAQEWGRYPKTLFSKLKLARVTIGANVRVNGLSRAAVPEFAPRWFWLDADVGSRIPTYGRHVLHHDFYHIIDEFDSPDGRQDKAWEKLNHPSVKYGQGGWFMQKPNVGELRTDIPGFLDEYATSAVEEDKAEVYSFLLTATPFVMSRAKADPVIAAKVARIKALVRAYEPSMDDAWFRRNASR